MGVRVEWHDANHVSAEVYPPGNDDWVGAGDQGDDWVLCISTDEVSAIHGTKEALLKIADDIREAVYKAESEPVEEEDDEPPTYHGIIKAECLTCGYVSTSRTTLETWNDLGLVCPECKPKIDDAGSTKWWLADGIVRITTQDAEGNLTTEDVKEDDDGD